MITVNPTGDPLLIAISASPPSASDTSRVTKRPGSILPEEGEERGRREGEEREEREKEWKEMGRDGEERKRRGE